MIKTVSLTSRACVAMRGFHVFSEQPFSPGIIFKVKTDSCKGVNIYIIAYNGEQNITNLPI